MTRKHTVHLALALALCFVLTHSVCAQSLAEPLKTVVPVHLNVATGDITVGSTVYPGGNPGLHMLALNRLPDTSHLDSPDLIADQTFTDATSANDFLQKVLSNDSNALLIVNAVGNYGFALNQVAKSLEQFGSAHDIEGVSNAIPFVLVGNGGLNTGQAHQSGFSNRDMTGYLAEDSNGNYTFIQPDYIRFDIGLDGTIKIGAKTYTVANSFKSYCNGTNALHLVVVQREAPDVLLANNTYCTSQGAEEIQRLVGDLKGVLGNEGRLVFLASNGHPIPPDWNFGTDGDARIYPLAQQIAQLGGYWETMVYLTPNDTYSLVGATAPPPGTPGARKRARESSSVYPDHPSGEMHGVLARGLRGNWYSPLTVDLSGKASLQFYEILAQQPVPFPHPSNAQELAAFQEIGTALYKKEGATCASPCNVRNSYADTSKDIGGSWYNALTQLQDSQKDDCDDPKNASIPFCIVQEQLETEFAYVGGIRLFNQNLDLLWSASGTNITLELESAYNGVLANVPPPPPAPAPSLMGPIVNFFLGLASVIPDIGPVFGVADTVFNFATSLTTDPTGNQGTSLTFPISDLEAKTAQQFNDQATARGTQFDFIYQDWGKISTLGAALANAQQGSPWYWNGSTNTGQILNAMIPDFQQAAYQSLMANGYAIGSYLPVCGACPGPTNWGYTPIWQQPQSYTVNDPDGPFSPGQADKAQPFNYPWYPPYTFPSDTSNPTQSPTQATATLLGAGGWLGISAITAPTDGGTNGLYEPPQAPLLAHLFTPRSQGGLGVYRPAFFEGWPLGRVTCGWSDDGEGDPGPGCNWSSAAPPPEALTAPLTSLAVAVTKSRNKFDVPGQIQVPLAYSNNGTVAIRSIKLDHISLRTLAGYGQATLVDPNLPIRTGSIMPGTWTTITLRLKVPPTIKKLEVIEEGTIDNGELTPYKFSNGQVVFPQRQQ